MKKFLTLGILLSFVVFLNSCEEPMAPTDYHDLIIDAYSELDSEIADFSFAIWDTTLTVADMEEYFENCQALVVKHQPILAETEELVDDPGLLKSVLKFYEVVESTLNNEYAEVMSYYEKETWESSYNAEIEELYDSAVDKIVAEEDKVINQQESFARAYGIELN